MSTTTPTISGTRSQMPGALRLGWDRTKYELRTFVRERDSMFFIFAYPIMMLVIFATVFGQDGATVDQEIPYAQYFLPGMIATGVLLSSFQALAVAIPQERDNDGLKRLHGTPLPAMSYFLGKIGQVLISSLIQMVLLIAVAALAFDVPLPQTAGRWWTLAWVFTLGAASGAVAGVGFSSLPRSAKSASAVVTPVVLVLQFISGVFFVFYQLPSWMQQVASFFPLKWMAQGMRSVFLPDRAATLEVTGTWEHPATAAVLAVWLVAGLVLGIRFFRWQRRDDA